MLSWAGVSFPLSTSVMFRTSERSSCLTVYAVYDIGQYHPVYKCLLTSVVSFCHYILHILHSSNKPWHTKKTTRHHTREARTGEASQLIVLRAQQLAKDGCLPCHPPGE